MPKGKLVELGGYGTAVQETPAKALESLGYKKALAEFGLTEELISTSLVNDIKQKPKRRFQELGLGAEILGMKKRDPGEMPPVQINIGIESLMAKIYADAPRKPSDSGA